MASNKALWLIGRDDMRFGAILELEHDDGQFYELMRIEPDADATGVGMVLSYAAMGMGLPLLFSNESKAEGRT